MIKLIINISTKSEFYKLNRNLNTNTRHPTFSNAMNKKKDNKE